MMGDTRNLGLQAGYLVCANNLRREAKLCDIILYVQGRMGAMVGYPAHKLLLISASKYFKLLFEREDLRNYCHFPHLSEEGVFAVLDIIYGREIRKETNLEDALMAARFLQVDCAVDTLEAKKEEAARASAEAARASPEMRRPSSSGSEQMHKKRRTADGSHRPSPGHNLAPPQSPSHSQADAKMFRNIKSPESSGMTRTFDMSDKQEQSWQSQDSPYSQTEQSGGGGYHDNSSLDQDPNTPTNDDSNMAAMVKMEPDVDLTADDSEEQGMISQEYGHNAQAQDNLTFAGQTFGAMNMDNSQSDGSNAYAGGDFGGSGSYQGGQQPNQTEVYISEDIALPLFSGSVEAHLRAGNTTSHVWNNAVKEMAEFYCHITPSKRYDVIGRKMCEKYPCLQRAGPTPWRSLVKSFSQKLRNNRRRGYKNVPQQ